MKRLVFLITAVFLFPCIAIAEINFGANSVNKTGSQSMTGPLSVTNGVTASSVTVTGSSFSIGDSTFVVRGGNVGIGKTPVVNLDVYGGSNATFQRWSNATTGTGAGNGLQLYQDDVAGLVFYENNTFSLGTGSQNTITMTYQQGVGISSQPATTSKFVVGEGAGLLDVRTSGQIFAQSLGAAGTGTALVISATKEIIPLTSSRRTKHNITGLKTDADKLLLLKPAEYDYNENNSHAIGFIAEEVYQILPKVVNLDKDGEPYSLSYDQLLTLAIVKIQSQQKQINALDKRLKVLEKKK